MSYTYYPITLRDGTYISKSLFCWSLVERVHGKKRPTVTSVKLLDFPFKLLCVSMWKSVRGHCWIKSQVKLNSMHPSISCFFQVRMCKGCTSAFLDFNLLYCHHNCFIKLSLDNYLVLQKLYMYNLNSISVIVHTM